ncbi:hypothetical protein CDAR_106971 [Caerostris darwini]|uniref:Uncharacterized protein n=1 Tax=Caerostris darwini TaxID=1538125 RepID=A0AAV4SY27_9ARAC|nr:hypothetical protein CDAR_106971 [Caerostris darwini]
MDESWKECDDSRGEKCDPLLHQPPPGVRRAAVVSPTPGENEGSRTRGEGSIMRWGKGLTRRGNEKRINCGAPGPSPSEEFLLRVLSFDSGTRIRVDPGRGGKGEVSSRCCH